MVLVRLGVCIVRHEQADGAAVQFIAAAWLGLGCQVFCNLIVHHPLPLLMSVGVQCCVYFGVAEPPVNFGTAERVAVLGEYDTLHLVRTALVFEPHFHALFLHINH